MKPLISVIIPVYNVEPYLARCVDSVLAQTYTNLEILLINDGSTDGSGQICDKYARKDKRIRVFHKQNGGVSSARNVGLDYARGEYIGFVDGDDYIAPTMYEKLLSALLEHKADISMCSVVDVWDSGNKKYAPIIYPSGHLYTDLKEWMKDFSIYGMYGVTWNKLFHKQVVGEIRFNSKLIRAEDVNFLFDVAKQDIRIFMIPQVLYYYFQRSSSAMRQMKIPYFESEYIVWKQIFEAVSQKNTDPSALMKKLYCKNLAIRAACLWIVIVLWDDNRQYNKRLKEVCGLLSNNVSNVAQVPGRRIRMLGYAVAYFPTFCVGILRVPGVKQTMRRYIQYRHA